VMHATGDRRVPFEDGRVLASLIPDARFVPLDSQNHLLLKDEPALGRFIDAVDQFMPPAHALKALPGLTTRESTVLEYVAQGLDNAQIAARMTLSEKTVRNYLVTILDKLQVETRAQAIVRAREGGMGQNPN
jgi:DNA-binding NarL/FixJ family response regulator